ncbi:hypothetical protein RhiirC2_795431 [Rhizophagus irregularis]|uniref:Uncharacterized protein n=1 Tax=Rhizophagus irregularis TaxID=588596 RepID=A0A2N1MBL8_9GLOM|nr:hypothetical protein RhiirC2_795431 [Rhizophagus irregularis]
MFLEYSSKDPEAEGWSSISKWNRLTKNTLNHQNKPVLTHTPGKDSEQIHHVWTKYEHRHIGYISHATLTHLSAYQQILNRQDCAKRNKKKKSLPSIPSGTPDYDVSSIPQYSYAYGVAMSFYEQHHVPRHTFIEDVTHNITNTPPSNQQSITSTISDNSYVSAV